MTQRDLLTMLSSGEPTRSHHPGQNDGWIRPGFGKTMGYDLRSPGQFTHSDWQRDENFFRGNRLLSCKPRREIDKHSGLALKHQTKLEGTMPISAAYFDGKSDQHTTGTLEVSDGHLVFTSEQGLPAYQNIANLKPPSPAADGKIMLEGIPEDESQRASRFIVLDSAFRRQLRPAIQRFRPGYGGGGTFWVIPVVVLVAAAAFAFWKFGLAR